MHKLKTLSSTGTICLESKDKTNREDNRDAALSVFYGTTFQVFRTFARLVFSDSLRFQALRRHC